MSAERLPAGRAVVPHETPISARFNAVESGVQGVAVSPGGPGQADRAGANTRLGRVPPQAFFGVSAVFHYLGPSFAVLLFARLDVLGVAWLRVASAALVFALWRRPWRSLRLLGR